MGLADHSCPSAAGQFLSHSNTEISAWADLVSASYSILPMEGSTFRAWARLMHRKPAALYEDAMIAATALVHGLTVVTRNVGDFEGFGVAVLNPFAPESK